MVSPLPDEGDIEGESLDGLEVSTDEDIPFPVVGEDVGRARIVDSREGQRPVGGRERDRELDAGRLEPALALFDEAIRVDELHADLHLRRGLALLRLGHSVEAVTALRQSLFLDSTSWPAAMLLGDLVADQDLDAAERFFRQARTSLASSNSGSESLAGALAPFAAGRTAALEAVDSRLADLQRASLAATVRQYAHS